MSLKCRKALCQSEIVSIDQLVFRQDAINGEWILTLNYELITEQSQVPPSIKVENNPQTTTKISCNKCSSLLGVVEKVFGFDDFTINFPSKHVSLFASKGDSHAVNSLDCRWSPQMLCKLPTIPQIKSPRLDPCKILVEPGTIHFNATSADLQIMIKTAKKQLKQSNFTLRNEQWRSYFFACLNDALLVLPTDSERNFIAQMLIEAYHELNPLKKIVFISPTAIMIYQQAINIEKNTGLKVQYCWKSEKDYSVLIESASVFACSYAILMEAIESKDLPLSKISLLVLDDVYKANKEVSDFGRLVTKLNESSTHQRPKILALFSSQSAENHITSNREIIETLCNKLKLVSPESKFQSQFDPIIEHEIQLFLDVYNQTDKLEILKPDNYVDDSISLHFYNFNNEIGLQRILQNNISNQIKNVRLFSEQQQVTAKFDLVEPKSKNKESLLSNLFKSMHSHAVQEGVSTWVKFPSELIHKHSNMNSMAFGQMTTFHFHDQHTVQLESPIVWNGRIDFTLESDCLKISYGDNQKFLIEKLNIYNPIIISETCENVTIFISLQKPPTYSTFRNSFPSPYNFSNRSFNFCLSRFLPYASLNQLRETLARISQVVHVVNIRQVSGKGNTSNRAIYDFDKYCLINQWRSKYASILPPVLSDNLINQLLSVSSNQLLEVILMNTEPKRFQELTTIDIGQIPADHVDKMAFKCDSNYVKIVTVKITQSRIIFMPSTLVSKNRIYRYFPSRENFVIVDFESENGRNPWNAYALAAHFKTLMINGFEIAGRIYTFLGCSNSQLREGKCWFSCLDRNMVYGKIGNLSHFTNPGRKLTRLAMAFSASHETVDVDHNKYLKNVEDDITNENGKVCFSDGIGRGSREFFEKISKQLELETIPSAFQIRIGGIKGVVSIFDQVEELTIRKSMKKFESAHNNFEVLNYSKSIHLSLNRHVILMLSSFGVPDEVFMELQQAELKICMKALTAINTKETINFVESRSKIIEWSKFPSSVVSEPFFRQILTNQVVERISEIADRAKISVENGRILMGVLDETNTLEYGEIYAHIIEDHLDIVLDGEVIIFRNPCVLPSDVRLLRARKNVPEKLSEFYKNVIVMPAQGRDSHARECSGGDLDGDLFSVVWDQRLIPPNLISPGREVIEVDTEEIRSPPKYVTDRDMIDFYCYCQQENHLGQIANAHLAKADYFGIESEQAIEIARYVVAETDAPIKGLSVGFDYEMANLKPMKYPHYMRKSDRESYNSKTIVGKLFNEALSISELIHQKFKFHPPTNYLSKSKDEASVDYWYSMYCSEIHQILESFQLSREADLFSGCPIWKKCIRSDFKRRTKAKITLNDTMKIFWMKWKKSFDSFRDKVSYDQGKILDWHNRSKHNQMFGSSFSLLALPYVINVEEERKSIIHSIQQSLVNWISLSKMNWIADWTNRKTIGDKICAHLNPILCSSYGNSTLGLNEESSHIDLCAIATDFDEVAYKLRTLDADAQNSKRRKSLTSYSLIFDSCPVEVTNISEDIMKTYLTYSIAECFDQNKHFWPSLRVLLEWARTIKVVESGGKQGIMTANNFVLLFIEYSLEKQLVIVNTSRPYSVQRLRDWIETSSDGLSCAQLIFNFLQKLSSLDSSAVASRKDPVSGLNLINLEMMHELRRNAQYALFILATHNGNIGKLFEYSTKHRIIRISNKLIIPSNSNKQLESQILKDIRNKAKLGKSSTCHLELIVQGASYYLDITSSDKNEIKDVENALDNIHSIFTHFNASRSKRESYSVENATLIIPEYSYGPETEVMLSPFKGNNFHPYHTSTVRAVIDVRTVTLLNHEWERIEYARFRNKFMMQIIQYEQSLPKFVCTNFEKFSKMKCVIRIGDQYFHHVPNSLINSIEPSSLQRLEQIVSQNESRYFNFHKAQVSGNYANQGFTRLKIPFKPNKLQTVPLKLHPLQDPKNFNRMRKRKREEEVSFAAMPNYLIGLRSTFFSSTKLTQANVTSFALQNRFCVADPTPLKVFINVEINHLEITIVTNNFGLVEDIQHRKLCWLSSTITNHKKNETGEDVQVCLETEEEFSQHENSLNSFKQNFCLTNRPIFHPDFLKMINRELINAELLPHNPLLPDLLNLNWKLHKMKVTRYVSKFENIIGDAIEFNEVFDGIFYSNNSFEWFEKRHEFEININSNQRNSEDICQTSYEMSLKLFNYSKTKHV